MRALVIVVGLGAIAGAAPRPGRVVRVDRGPRGWMGAPRFCQITTPDLNGFCIGKKPEIGDRMAIVDNARVLGEVRITASNAYPNNGACAQDNVWVVQGALETGDVSSPQGDTVGLIDVALDPRLGHIISVDRSPSGRALGIDQEIIHAIDTNGDGNADLEVTQYACDDQGLASLTATSSCFDWWARSSRGFDRIRQDRVRNCL